MAIVQEADGAWGVYILNHNLISLQTLMITSKGYGFVEGTNKETSVLRHLIEELEGNAVARVESIDPKLFQLTNEFWVSYYILDQIFDKKFIFVQGSMDKTNLRYIPELEMHGVLHV